MNPLDSPIWNALSTTHTSFAEGNDVAKRYPFAVTPLAATRDQSAVSYEALIKLVGPGERAALFLETSPLSSPGWNSVPAHLVQMIWDSSGAVPPEDHLVEVLGVANIQEMLSLAELTKPGPFGRRTPELGSYVGIREAGQLIAMAGERLRMPGYTEVSAVCTHPEHRGRGYATLLVSALINRITNRGETPFLHVRAENADAIRVYEKLGFKTRRILNLAILTRE